MSDEPCFNCGNRGRKTVGLVFCTPGYSDDHWGEKNSSSIKLLCRLCYEDETDDRKGTLAYTILERREE